MKYANLDVTTPTKLYTHMKRELTHTIPTDTFGLTKMDREGRRDQPEREHS